MARKSINITIEEADQKLEFVITQMSAMQLHDFTLKIGMLLLGTNVAASLNSLEVVGQIGAKLAQEGLSVLRGLSFENTKPLLNELLACCERTGAGILQKCTPEMLDTVTNDPATVFKLEVEAAKLNFSFFSQALAGSSVFPAAQNGGQPETNAA